MHKNDNNHLSISSLVILHHILSFNFYRSNLVWHMISELIIKEIDKKSDNALLYYLPYILLSVFDVNTQISSPIVIKDTIKLICVVSDEFLKKNDQFILRIIKKLFAIQIQDDSYFNDMLNMLIIHTSQTQAFMKIFCSENILLIKSIIENPHFVSQRANQMTSFMCNIYKTIASTQYFKQYMLVLTLFYKKLITFIQQKDSTFELCVNNFQSISLFFFVACCHPIAEIRQNSLTTLQTTTPQFFTNVDGNIITYFFKSLSTFIGGISSKKRTEIPMRCMDLVSKVFLTSHLDILEKSSECWTIVLGIIAKLKENKSDEICEVIKNILFVLIYEKKLVEGTEQWKQTWNVIEGLLHESDFVEKKQEVPVTQPVEDNQSNQTNQVNETEKKEENNQSNQANETEKKEEVVAEKKENETHETKPSE